LRLGRHVDQRAAELPCVPAERSEVQVIGYAALEVFPPALTALWLKATSLVERARDTDFAVKPVRCHELVRAVAEVLDLPRGCVQDGYYGFAEHSWLWVPGPPESPLSKRVGWPHILDVYSVGQMPMVRLVAGDNTGLPHVGWSYRPDAPRTDIDSAVVERLVGEMRKLNAPSVGSV
jgi:hypothetical protein